MDDAPTPPGPGWYDDPHMPGRRRWWTGSEWGPVQRVEQQQNSQKPWRDLLPVAVFAFGFASIVIAVLLIFYPPIHVDALNCGNLVSGGSEPRGELQEFGFDELGDARCDSAKLSRMAWVGILFVAGVGMIAGSFVIKGRAVSRRRAEEVGRAGAGSTGRDAKGDAGVAAEAPVDPASRDVGVGSSGGRHGSAAEDQRGAPDGPGGPA